MEPMRSHTLVHVAALQGVVRPGLLSLRERYRLRGRELAEDGLVLAEQLDAAREANAERLEELAALRRQVSIPAWHAILIVNPSLLSPFLLFSMLSCDSERDSSGTASFVKCALQLQACYGSSVHKGTAVLLPGVT